MSASLEPASAQSVTTFTVLVTSADGARSELICVQPAEPVQQWIYWLPALGVAAKHYLPLAETFAERGFAVALHEWRGMGSSDRRASRSSDWGYRQLLEMDLAAGVRQAGLCWPQAKPWMGGHSLGGQLACLYASLHRSDIAGILLAASGAPYWRSFAYAPLIFAALVVVGPLSKLLGYLPGRRIGFGGNEARGVISDWSRSGRSGRYAASGMGVDFEQQLAALRAPVFALQLRDDWLAPSRSLAWLLDKMPQTAKRTAIIRPDQLAGPKADHFGWMKTPASLVAQWAVWMNADTHT
ncbi:alpha/beta hydrolase family protein [Dyella choica]|uniref:Alpha/beta fold hydrolase n=1 Tax=Dyella choica TaxID=1927959 RepID=A0A3S0PIR9_9GAMM|nr:alpha/beta fold hydrolase [Dyella choica]RUL69607.1 alpha/beta fold hydrolase [Dyella choica]